MLSIITITRNDPTGFLATLQSLVPLLEAGIPWQHIVVDSSPDETRTALADLRANWPLIHVKTPPRGIYAAFNEGMDHAAGDVVWFLNGGDRLRDVETLARLLERLRSRPETALVCAAVDGVRDGEFLYTHEPRADFAANLLGRNTICHQGVLYRRRSLAAIGYYSIDYQIAGDYDHHLRCLIAGLVADCCSERLAEFDMSGASTNWRRTLAEFRQALSVHRHQLGPRFHQRAVAGLRLEWLRIFVVKRLAQSRFRSVLRPMWLRWNRSKTAQAKA